ncbi:autotransporter outer membrane beta-barrel domain-containing protein [Prosthecobacter vanneervenii]|uniref:Uncharacterized protein YhjY with autotransporter beta-barrel domain n=1 Tax=Prosthecobacter vanneervenii TaxID=48466 RepID=A0A7W7Y9K8_9BACT|nr:autotransporter outer membrane beta-barrel domain-containing protein [Prosthecobacter vanneervenii]MBB5031800.1 uncharacterized protein YhjY with autotransporter beta-barrel domain [Prosthecobacter vanneervenii]
MNHLVFCRPVLTMLAAAAWMTSVVTAPLHAEVVVGNSFPDGGSASVQPYPTGMSVIDFFSQNGPGVHVQDFSVSQNYILNSVTIQMANATSTAGGFGLSLQTLSANGGGTVTFSLVQDLAGSSNPATAGSYTYTGSAPMAAGSSFWVVGQVGAGGGTYNWQTSSDGGSRYFVIANGSAGPGIPGPLNLNDVLLFASPGGGLLFSVDATLIDTEGALQLALGEQQGVLAGSQTVLGDVNNQLFNLRAGGGEEDDEGGIAASLDEGVVLGQGDGPESPIARRVRRSRQWEAFTTVNYGNLRLSPVSSQAGVQVDSWAPAVGLQRHLSRGLTAGFAVTILSSSQHYTGGLGSLNLDGPALSAYLSYVRKGFWGNLLYSFGDYQISSTRNPGGGLPFALGSTYAYTNAIQFNTGWNFRFQNGTLVTGPFAGIDYLHGSINAYSETGGGIAGMSYASQSFQSLVTRVGWSLSKKIATDFAVITPQVRLSYERQNVSSNGTSVQAINAPFSASGGNQSPGQDYMVAGGGVNFQFSPAFGLLLGYQTQFFRNNLQAHFGSVRLSYKF